jgi:hypothetical protein
MGDRVRRRWRVRPGSPLEVCLLIGLAVAILAAGPHP